MFQQTSYFKHAFSNGYLKKWIYNKLLFLSFFNSSGILNRSSFFSAAIFVRAVIFLRGVSKCRVQDPDLR